jgi:uncharacterized tellurite resistance protein B-like protein
MSFLEIFGFGKKEGEESSSLQTGVVRKIVESLDRMDPQQAKYVAAFAYLLGRLANSDLDISQEETLTMERLVVEVGGLPEEQAMLVVQMAKSHAKLFGGTENFLVTREFSRMASHEQKLDLIRCLFAVAAADLSISAIEDNEIRQISSELNLEHPEYIEIKAAHSEYLEVLKKPKE